MFIADYQYYCGVCRFASVDFDIVILMLQISARTGDVLDAATRENRGPMPQSCSP
jgi:hypothetical protein